MSYGCALMYTASENNTPGLEFAGIVTDVHSGSEGANNLRVGDKVALTALYGLQMLGGLQPNACLLIHRRFDCRVLGTVGDPSKVQLLQERFSGSQGPSTVSLEDTMLYLLDTPVQFAA
eukprot:scaffold34032_cov22-Tisochrysis_lutea.AAC.3